MLTGGKLKKKNGHVKNVTYWGVEDTNGRHSINISL